MPESTDDPSQVKRDAEALARAVVRRVKALRQEKGITRYRVAQLAQLHQRAVKFVEEEDRIPSIDTLARMILALGLSVSDVIRQAEEDLQSSDNEVTKGN